jgi:hypothetical protein
MIERFQGRVLDEAERQTIGNVERVGWHIVNIRDEEDSPGWAFTIGLYENFQHPEVVVFGLKDSRVSVLNWIGENVRDGKPFTAGAKHDWVLEGYDCWSREVQGKWFRDILGWAIWFYGGVEFPSVQCIWPARDGSYPWEESAAFFAPQPLLYEDEVVSARMFHYVEDAELAKVAWPFPSDPHQRVFVSRCVVEDGAPILQVFHEEDGDWHFIGPVADPDADGCQLSCFHCVLERDPTIRLVAKLRPGWIALRDSVSHEWRILKSPGVV